MTLETDRLIDTLATGVTPVKRLYPPLYRATLWLACVAVVGAMYAWKFADMDRFADYAASPRVKLEWLATVFTGITGICAAYHLTIPGRSARWVYVPLPPLLAWLSLSGYGCLGHQIGGFDKTVSPHCFTFIVLTSLPLGFLLFWRLRRAQPLAPLAVAMTGGIGVAGCAAALLALRHPFDVTFIDLAVHTLAITLVVGLCMIFRRRALAV